jgi:hypothetical protein
MDRGKRFAFTPRLYAAKSCSLTSLCHGYKYCYYTQHSPGFVITTTVQVSQQKIGKQLLHDKLIMNMITNHDGQNTTFTAMLIIKNVQNIDIWHIKPHSLSYLQVIFWAIQPSERPSHKRLPTLPHNRHNHSQSLDTSQAFNEALATGHFCAEASLGTEGCSWTLALWCSSVAFVTGHTEPDSFSVK